MGSLGLPTGFQAHFCASKQGFAALAGTGDAGPTGIVWELAMDANRIIHQVP